MANCISKVVNSLRRSSNSALATARNMPRNINWCCSCPTKWSVKNCWKNRIRGSAPTAANAFPAPISCGSIRVCMKRQNRSSSLKQSQQRQPNSERRMVKALRHRRPPRIAIIDWTRERFVNGNWLYRKTRAHRVRRCGTLVAIAAKCLRSFWVIKSTRTPFTRWMWTTDDSRSKRPPRNARRMLTGIRSQRQRRRPQRSGSCVQRASGIFRTRNDLRWVRWGKGKTGTGLTSLNFSISRNIKCCNASRTKRNRCNVNFVRNEFAHRPPWPCTCEHTARTMDYSSVHFARNAIRIRCCSRNMSKFIWKMAPTIVCTATRSSPNTRRFGSTCNWTTRRCATSARVVRRNSNRDTNWRSIACAIRIFGSSCAPIVASNSSERVCASLLFSAAGILIKQNLLFRQTARTHSQGSCDQKRSNNQNGSFAGIHGDQKGIARQIGASNYLLWNWTNSKCGPSFGKCARNSEKCEIPSQSGGQRLSAIHLQMQRLYVGLQASRHARQSHGQTASKHQHRFGAWTEFTDFTNATMLLLHILRQSVQKQFKAKGTHSQVSSGPWITTVDATKKHRRWPWDWRSPRSIIFRKH